jgi:streptogrisin C
VKVTGSQNVAVGSTVCRSGSTTGWRCGRILTRNATVTYPQGTVSGLIRTNVCSEPGDSGGSLVAGSQAQGVASGGNRLKRRVVRPVAG